MPPQPHWRRFTAQNSYGDTHVGARIGHTAVALRAPRRTTKLDVFEARMQDANADRATAETSGEKKADNAAGNEQARFEVGPHGLAQVDGHYGKYDRRADPGRLVRGAKDAGKPANLESYEVEQELHQSLPRLNR